jgi:hypothetical protein
MELIPSDNVVELGMVGDQINQVETADLRAEHLAETAMVVKDLMKIRYIDTTPGQDLDLDLNSRHRET